MFLGGYGRAFLWGRECVEWREIFGEGVKKIFFFSDGILYVTQYYPWNMFRNMCYLWNMFFSECAHSGVCSLDTACLSVRV